MKAQEAWCVMLQQCCPTPICSILACGFVCWAQAMSVPAFGCAMEHGRTAETVSKSVHAVARLVPGSRKGVQAVQHCATARLSTGKGSKLANC